MFEIETNHCKREKLQIGRTKTIEREKKVKNLNSKRLYKPKYADLFTQYWKAFAFFYVCHT